MRIRVRCLVGALLMLAAGCSPTEGPVASKYVKSVPVTASSGAAISVSPQESEALAGAALVIPPGALAQNTTITVKVGLEDLVQGADAPVGPAAVWGPAGTRFATEAEMTLPFALSSGALAEDLYVQVQERDGSRTEIPNDKLTIDSASGLLRFKVSGFTGFQSGARGCSSNSACRAGKVCVNGRCRNPNGCTPTQEVCDGKDNDCDSQVDEGCNTSCDPTRPCPAGQSCVNGACQATCTAAQEVCDGKDNDCDGQVDEGCSIQCDPARGCPTGYSCLNGYCQQCSSGGCQTDAGTPDAGLTCTGRNPVGCVQTGCASGEVCDTNAGCAPSACGCDSATGQFICTADCNGGTCVPAGGQDAGVLDGGSSNCGGTVCGTNQVCVNQTCRDMCRTNADCSSGQQCAQGLCY